MAPPKVQHQESHQLSRKKTVDFIRSFGIIFFALFIGANAFADDSNTSKKNCEIKVQYFFKTEARLTKTYHKVATSESDCIKKSKPYKVNSNPKKLKRKEVSIQWLGN